MLRLRRALARFVGTLVLLLTLGRVTVDLTGVKITTAGRADAAISRRVDKGGA